MDFEYPEERLAKRVIDRFNLQPPIDIVSLAQKYATVKICEFPVEVDGVSVGLKQRNVLPRIYVNSSGSLRRQRFTLAHELGHVLIPWHVGTIVDELDLWESSEHSKYWEMEAEANRFASELLMPEAWVRSIWGSETSIDDVISRVSKEAEVSVDAAVLRALKFGPSGFIVAKSQGRRVVWAGRTMGTLANRPASGSIVSANLINPATDYAVISAYGGSYHCWKESTQKKVPADTGEDWRTILQGIISDLDIENPKKVMQSINGIIASANGRVRENRTRDRIYAACLQRIRNRSDQNPDICRVISHKRFMDFLVSKVYSLNI